MRYATTILIGWAVLASHGAGADGRQPAASAIVADDGALPATNAAIAERAAALLEARYVFPALGARYAKALRDHIMRGDYAQITDRAQLAQRLTADLQAVSPDGHLRVYRVKPQETPPPPAPAPTSGAIVAKEGERSIAPGIRAIGWAAPGVAYISFEHFDDRPEAIAAVTRFLADYRSAKALIIDSRGNHGGAFDMLGLFANNLFSSERHLADLDIARAVVDELGAPFPVDGQILRRGTAPPGLVRFEHWSVPAKGNGSWAGKPVYYLTSRQTYSAAEHLALILKTTGRAVLVGEPTGGGNHFGGTEPIGGGLELFVPIGRTSDPATGWDWERTGVSPDVPVAADRALDEALRRIAGAPASGASPAFSSPAPRTRSRR